jgi:hypothetical protein
MARSPITKDVSGAPYQIGDAVKVCKGADETFAPEFLGRVGRIVHFEYACGCGQTFPSDPMVGVGFRQGVVEEFWREEIVLAPRSRSSRLNARRTGHRSSRGTSSNSASRGG